MSYQVGGGFLTFGDNGEISCSCGTKRVVQLYSGAYPCEHIKQWCLDLPEGYDPYRKIGVAMGQSGPIGPSVQMLPNLKRLVDLNAKPQGRRPADPVIGGQFGKRKIRE
jgi:hypothetical protein